MHGRDAADPNAKETQRKIPARMNAAGNEKTFRFLRNRGKKEAEQKNVQEPEKRNVRIQKMRERKEERTPESGNHAAMARTEPRHDKAAAKQFLRASLHAKGKEQ